MYMYLFVKFSWNATFMDYSAHVTYDGSSSYGEHCYCCWWCTLKLITVEHERFRCSPMCSVWDWSYLDVCNVCNWGITDLPKTMICVMCADLRHFASSSGGLVVSTDPDTGTVCCLSFSKLCVMNLRNRLTLLVGRLEGIWPVKACFNYL